MKSSDDPFVKDLVEKLDTWFLEDNLQEQPTFTRELYPYTHIFSPIEVNGLQIKNRIIMGPMGNINMAEETGRPNDKLIQYFTERARGGVGLITSGLVPVSQNIDPTLTEPGELSYFPRINRSRTVFSGWRDLAENIHAYGSRFFIQLTPGLGRVGSPEVLLKKFTLPVSASWNSNFYLPEIPCRPLMDWECRSIIKATAQAAADAKALLVDGVYLHGHEGYLLEQMTNPAFNRRVLGRYANWQTFGLDLVREIRKRVGNHYPIMYRIDLSLGLNAAYGERMETIKGLRNFRNERTSQMTLKYMANLVKVGVDIFDVDLGSYDNWWLPHPPNSMPSGCYLEIARLVKNFFSDNQIQSNTGYPVPIVGVGKLGYPDLAEKALRDGMCDMVMLARPLLADPQWVNKAYSGLVEEIRPCIGDQEACLNEFLEGGHPQCSVNPLTGFEDVYERDLLPALKRKNVAVIGAGPAGILCATTAARRGHQVTLFEKTSTIGGMLVPGSVPRIKYEIKNYLGYLERQVTACTKEYNLSLRLNTEATIPLLSSSPFDSVIFCTGSIQTPPPSLQTSLPHIVQAVDIFRDPTLVDKANEVVIIGGGSVGCECAHFLAAEKGKKVSIIEMLPHFMKGVCTANRTHMIHSLEKLGVQLFNCARLVDINDQHVLIEHNKSPTVPDPYNTWNPLLPDNLINPLAKPFRIELKERVIHADLVIMAIGLTPDQTLYDACQKAGIGNELYQIGDAFQVGRVFEAVKAGYSVGRTL